MPATRGRARYGCRGRWRNQRAHGRRASCDLVSVWGSGAGDVFAVSTGRDLTCIRSIGSIGARSLGRRELVDDRCRPDPLSCHRLVGERSRTICSSSEASITPASPLEWRRLEPDERAESTGGCLLSSCGAAVRRRFRRRWRPRSCSLGRRAVERRDARATRSCASRDRGRKRPRRRIRRRLRRRPSSIAAAGTGNRFVFPGWMTIGLSVTPGRVFVVGGAGEAHLDRPSVTCVAPERDCNDGWDNDCDGLPDGAIPIARARSSSSAPTSRTTTATANRLRRPRLRRISVLQGA